MTIEASFSAKGRRICVVDAFTAVPFAGNPAAVCLLDGYDDCPDAWRQALAQEMNLSETAFLVPEADGFALRWFTPTREVDLCGHATLASAHFLWESGVLPERQEAYFHTRSGPLTATRSGKWIEMDLPAEVPAECAAPAQLAEALRGLTPLWTGRNRMDLVVEVESEQALRELQPDFDAICTIEARGLIVTAKGTDGCDIVSRCFYPGAGIPEDPVTGSAHCALAPYWAAKLGVQEMVARQASKRGGELRLRLEGSRIRIAGQAVTVWQGEMVI